MERITNIYEVTHRLCGMIEPIGETNVDEVRLLNLRDTIEVAEKLFHDIKEVSRHSNRDEHSMQKAGKEAQEFLNRIRDTFPS